MSASGCFLMLADDGWSVAAATALGEFERLGDRDLPPAELTALVLEFARMGNLPRRVVIGLSSRDVLCAEFSLEETGDSRQRHNLIYRLEEKLPLAAEEFSADFLGQDQLHFLGIATEIAPLRPYVDALEQSAIIVESITPTVLVGLQGFLGSKKVVEFYFCSLLWQHGNGLEYLFGTANFPFRWRQIQVDETALRRELLWDYSNTSAPKEVAAINFDESLYSALENIEKIKVRKLLADPLEIYARRLAGRILARRETPWIELRRDALAAADPWRSSRPAMTRLMAAAMAFLLCVNAALWWRTHRLNTAAESLREQQTALYQELFPGTKTPAGIRARLQSEARRLAGSTAALTARESEPQTVLPLAHAALSALRTDQNALLDDLRIGEGELTLIWRTTQNEAVTAVIEELERQCLKIEDRNTSHEEQESFWTTELRAAGKVNAGSGGKIGNELTGKSAPIDASAEKVFPTPPTREGG